MGLVGFVSLAPVSTPVPPLASLFVALTSPDDSSVDRSGATSSLPQLTENAASQELNASRDTYFIDASTTAG
jgi:hypothetical protein